MTKPQLTVDVKPRSIESAYVDVPFDIGLETLKEAGYSLVSPKDLADLRIQEGSQSNVSRNGSWTTFGILYVPDKGRYLTRNSPIVGNAKEATEAHRTGKEFYLTPKQVEEGLVGAVKIDSNDIPTKRFGEHPVTIYAFGDSAQKYGDFLKEAGISKVPVWLADVSDKSFARQLWLHRLGDGGGSGLNGDYRGLGIALGMRGVRDVVPVQQMVEQVGEKKVLAYTPAQVSDALKDLGFSGLEERLLERLGQ